MASTAPPSLEDQAALWEEALGFAGEQRCNLRKALDSKDMDTALRCGLRLANELRTSQLLPENYYRLYQLVFWELQHIAASIAQRSQDAEFAELYEAVQHEGSALPRLYLLVTVGAVYAQACPDRVREILDDLASMLTAVQHPMRGLFLRYYLVQSVKDKLALLGVREALQYLLLNFRESVSLWARLRLPGGTAAPSSEAAAGCGGEGSAVVSFGTTVLPEDLWRLDRTRQTLRLLVGAHLMHMARLRGLTTELYVESLMPEVFRLITAFEDPAGQAYLLRCFIEVFPDPFHLRTLDRVLATCAQVHWVVDLRPLLQHLLRRLTDYLANKTGPPPDAPEGFDTFAQFHAHLRQLHARPRSAATPLASLLNLQLELALASLALHPGDAKRLELVLWGTVELLRRCDAEPLDQGAVEAIVDILAAPMTQESLVPAVLSMPHHAALQGRLGRAAKREAALAMVTAILAGDVSIRASDTLHSLLALIQRLTRDEGASAEAEAAGAQRHLEHDPVAFTAEQERVARLVHQVRHRDPREVFTMLAVLRDYFGEGGPHRLVFTLPALVAAALRLVGVLLPTPQEPPRTGNPIVDIPLVQELFQFAFSASASLGTLQPEEALRHWLLCTAAADRAARAASATSGGESESSARAKLAVICGRFLEAALSCLQCQIKYPLRQLGGLRLVVGTLREVPCLDNALYEDAATRVSRVACQLPSRRLQSRGLSLCCSLYSNSVRGMAGRALPCLRRALRFADGAIHVDPLDVGLFVEVLDQATHLFAQGSKEITAPFLSGLLALCAQHLRFVAAGAPLDVLRGLGATLHDLATRKAEDKLRGLGERYAELDLSMAADIQTMLHAATEVEAA